MTKQGAVGFSGFSIKFRYATFEIVIIVASVVGTTFEYRKRYTDYEDFARNTDFEHQITVYDSNVIYSN